MNTEKPLVSVCMITYAHEEFIREAIDSIVAQKTNFKFEIIIGEDCGPDNTRDICIEYQQQYPDLIRLNLQQNNVGSQNNFVDTLNMCQGKYIAICEGDDYWIDPLKLQKQVDFLERNPDFSLCAHISDILEFGTLIKGESNTNDEFDIYDIINQNWGIMTASILFRSDSLEKPDWYRKVINGDYALQLLISSKGKVKVLSESMSVYRRHPGGISMKLKPFVQTSWLIYLLFEFNNYSNKKYNKEILQKIKTTYKNQIGFAKEYHLRKDYIKLRFFQLISVFSPFAIKNYRK